MLSHIARDTHLIKAMQSHQNLVALAYLVGRVKVFPPLSKQMCCLVSALFRSGDVISLPCLQRSRTNRKVVSITPLAVFKKVETYYIVCRRNHMTGVFSIHLRSDTGGVTDVYGLSYPARIPAPPFSTHSTRSLVIPFYVALIFL